MDLLAKYTPRNNAPMDAMAKLCGFPGKLGMAGFNGVDFLEGLPMRLATIDACRRDIGIRAANIIAGRGDSGVIGGHRIELEPRLEPGDTIR